MTSIAIRDGVTVDVVSSVEEAKESIKKNFAYNFLNEERTMHKVENAKTLKALRKATEDILEIEEVL